MAGIFEGIELEDEGEKFMEFALSFAESRAKSVAIRVQRKWEDYAAEVVNSTAWKIVKKREVAIGLFAYFKCLWAIEKITSGKSKMDFSNTSAALYLTTIGLESALEEAGAKFSDIIPAYPYLQLHAFGYFDDQEYGLKQRGEDNGDNAATAAERPI